jgi:hypothetical protein
MERVGNVGQAFLFLLWSWFGWAAFQSKFFFSGGKPHRDRRHGTISMEKLILEGARALALSPGARSLGTRPLAESAKMSGREPERSADPVFDFKLGRFAS